VCIERKRKKLRNKIRERIEEEKKEKRKREKERERRDIGWGIKTYVYLLLEFKRMPSNSLNSSNFISFEARGKIEKKRKRGKESEREEKRDYYMFKTNNVDFEM
jgi:hypothetical protein